MDILAGIEAASNANNNLKQYMATVSQLASANGLTPSDLASNPFGSALQTLITGPLANVAHLLPGQSSSVPNIGPLNPLLVAAAAALSEQHAKSMFNNASPLALSLPSMVNFNAFSNILHSHNIGPEGEEASAEKRQKEENVPTLVSLLASASVGTPQRQRNRQQQRQMANSPATQIHSPPPAKRPRLLHQSAKEGFCEHSNSLFGTSTTSEFPTTIGSCPSSTEVPTASLLSALTAVSGKFPLTAASPPALPSPPNAQNALASSVAQQPQKSAQNSPTNNTLVRRLSSLSTSSSTSGSMTAAARNGMPIVLPRTPQRKPAAPIPLEKKDLAYYERRRKNNDAAKRSRDTRRLKEEMTAQRATYLEQENSQLKKQVGMLNAELAKFKAILLSITPPTPNVPSSTLLNTPPPKTHNGSSAGRRRHCHVLASPTSTTTANEADAECHSEKSTVAAEEDEIRSMKRRETPCGDKDEAKDSSNGYTATTDNVDIS